MQANPGKLVRQIMEAFKEPPSDFVLGRLAAEYATLCQEATQRLDQCLVLLSRKDEFGAWNIASTEPDLLDLLEVVAFPQSADWKKLCQEHGLPVAPSFDDYAVEQVGNLYSKGINENHPLYGDYRKAVRLRDDEGALRALSSIVRLNPSDTHAAGERARLEQKWLRQLLTDLERFLATGNRGEVISLLEKLEAFKWSTPPQSPLIDRACTVRQEEWRDQARAEAREIVHKIEALKVGELAEQAEPLYGEIETFEASYELAWTSEEQDKLRQIKAWLVKERANRLATQQLARAQTALESLLGRLESRPISRIGTSADIETEKAALERAWRDVESVGKSVAEPLLLRVRRMAGSLRNEIVRRQKMRYIAIGCAVTVSIIGIGIGAWWLHDRQVINDLTTRLIAVREHGTTTEATTLIALIDKEHARRASKPELAGQLALVKDWVASQTLQIDQYKNKLAQVEQAIHTIKNDSTSEEIAAVTMTISEFNRFHDGLAVNFRSEHETEKIRTQTLWEETSQQWANQQTGAFREKLSQAEQVIQSAVSSLTMQDIALGIQKAQVQLDAVQVIASNLTRRNALPSEDNARVNALDSIIKEWRSEHERWQKAELAIHQAISAQDYKKALESLQGIRPSSDPLVSNARLVLATWDSFDNSRLLREYLMPNDPQAWAFLTNQPPVDLDPKSFPSLPPETTIFENLDDMIPDSDIVQTEIEEFNPGGSIRKKIFTKGKSLFQQLIEHKDGSKDYSWKQTRYSANGPQEFIADSIYKDNTITKGIGILGHQPAKEPEFFAQFLGKKYVDGNSGRLKYSPLLILDELHRRLDLNPLFRAYVEQELIRIIEMRPHWGVPYNPALKDFIVQYKTIFIRPIEKQEWLYEQSIIQRKIELSAYANIFTPKNIWQTTDIKQHLINSAIKGEFVYTGEINLDQRPRLLGEHSSSGKIWSVQKDGKLWCGNSNSDWAKINLQPLAPVFTFRSGSQNETEILAAIWPTNQNVNPTPDSLPPLFRP